MAVLAGVALLATGCSSQSSTGNSGGGGGGGGGGGTQTSAPATAPGTILTATGPIGTYLTDYQGKALYLFAKDTASGSTCTGTCAVNWPPLTITSTIPKAGAGVTQNMLSTFIRPDGSVQIAYNGHALYYFKGDSAAGDIKGQGVNGDGGLWYLISPAGAAITAKAPAAGIDPGAGLGGGY